MVMARATAGLAHATHSSHACSPRLEPDIVRMSDVLDMYLRWTWRLRAHTTGSTAIQNPIEFEARSI